LFFIDLKGGAGRMASNPKVNEVREPAIPNALPVIDVSGLASSDLTDRAGVAAELGRACRGTGFFYVVNHGILDSQRDALFAAAQTFFAQPASEKDRLSIKRSPHNRGYVALQAERLDQSAAHSDYKEAFNIGLEMAPDDPEVLAQKPFRGVNLWPVLAGWRETVLAYYNACWELGRRIHRGFALDLGIAEDFFEDKLDAPLATLRVLHYPPQPDRRDSTPDSGAGAHTDYGNLTILATDAVAGLQVRARNGAWIDAPYIPGAFVCNIGDCMMRWTNDIYVSTPHRVAIPVRDRYSAAFFLDPNPEARVEVLPSCVAPGASPKYPPTTGADYIRERLTATYDHLKERA
jgi:isopenicillin N synthase-like dioxygenase